MPNKMLIDATHPEETRVVVVRGNRVEEFDFETAQRKQLRGNIYLAKVTRVEPSLQAAFIEYGSNRHGFLAFSEIHPDYYQIPVADRQALIEADERAHREAEEETENRSSNRGRRPRHRNSRRRGGGDRVQSDVVDNAGAESAQAVQPHEAHEHLEGGHAEDGHVHSHDAEQHDAHAGHHDHDDHEHAHDHGHDHDHDHSHDHDHAHEHEHAGEAHAAPSQSETPVTAAIEASAATSDAPVNAEAHDEHGHDEHARENAAHADDAPHAEDGGDEHAEDGGEHAASDHAEHASAPHGDEHHDDEDDGDDAEEELVESVGGDDVMEEVPERAFRPRRQYKIQEVIKRRQVMLVQVVKEERGNKGAALTTYLSLAGPYPRLRGRLADQAFAARSLQQGNRRNPGRRRSRVPGSPRFHEDADAVERARGQTISRRPAAVLQDGRREPVGCDVLADRAVALRRLYRNQPDRSAGVDRRQFRPFDPRTSHRGYRTQDQSGGVGGSCTAAPAARPRRSDRHRLHRHGREAQQPFGRAQAQRLPAPGPRPDPGRADLAFRPARNVPPADSRQRAGEFDRALPAMRWQRPCAFGVFGGAAVAARPRGNIDEGRDPQSGGADPDRRRALRPQPQARPSARSRKQLQGDAVGDRRSDRERPAIVHHRSRRAGAHAGGRQGAAGGTGRGLPAADRGSL